MKFCVNCRYFQAPKPPLDVGEYAQCVYGMTLHPVTGDMTLKTQSSIYAITVRRSHDAGNCGPDARFYTEKPAVVQFPDLKVIP